MLFLRSLLFSIIMLFLTVMVAVVGVIVAPLPIKKRYYAIRFYALLNLLALKYICGIHYEVSGRENIGIEPCVIMSNHQSTWETLIVQAIFPHLCFVVKRELLWVPFFGWALALLKPIAINRKSGRNAVQQVVEQGSARLKSGIWVVIFPEGTRTSYGKKGRYKKGGAILASSSGFNVIPMAHNAGKYWPKKGFIKKPGTIKVIIGEKIITESLTTEQIATRTEHWIESAKAKIL